MSEVINLAKGNGDDHVYEAAANILAKILTHDYSFVIQVWNQEIPSTKYPKILILTSDEMHGIPQQLNNKDVVHIFKQYAPMSKIKDNRSTLNIKGVTPIPLCHLSGVIKKDIPIMDREFDWCWLGQFDPYSRVDFREAIDKLSNVEGLKYRSLWYEGWNNGISKQEYSDIINNSKIVFAPTGSASLETFRFFEGLMCGCFVISIFQPYTKFYSLAPYMPVQNWSNIIECTKYVLGNENLMREFSRQAKEWYEYFCSPIGLANYMKESLNV